MILPNIKLTSRINQHWEYSGMDSLDRCQDQQHFLSYPHQVDYVYNSRGFRDGEWPTSIEGLKNAIWCFGDSFTVGLGQPYEHTWPYILSKKLNRKTINISMDGASNEWIARKSQEVIENINPKNIVIMWSYTHRRELPDTNLTDEERRIYSRHNNTDEENYLNWVTLVNKCQHYSTNIIHSTVPRFHSVDIKQHNAKMYKNIIFTPQLDWARDFHHFDILTAEWLADQISPQLVD